jgi:hypothetical protein
VLPQAQRESECANDTNRKVANVAPPGLAAVEAGHLADDLEGE